MLSEQHPKNSIVYITLYIQKTPISNTIVILESHLQIAFPIAMVT